MAGEVLRLNIFTNSNFLCFVLGFRAENPPLRKADAVSGNVMTTKYHT
jgi:hypothetical protein